MDKLTEVTLEHLIITPYELITILDINFERDINEHAKFRAKAIVPEEVKDEYIFNSNFGKVVELIQSKDGEDKTLFTGLLSKIRIETEGELYILYIEVISHSYLLDIKVKRRSFQDINMTYFNLVTQVSSEYGASVIFTQNKGRTQNEFIIEYKETDWQFIKRMASRFNQGLYPSVSNRKPSYFFGAPEINDGITIDEHVFVIRKDIADYEYLSSNYIDDVAEFDFINYWVETYIQLELGENVTYKGLSLYVKSIRASLVNSVLRFEYLLCSKKGLQKEYFENPQLQGIAVFGHVIAIQRDQVKVHIHEIDKSQDVGTAYWFPYSAMYASDDGSGWYCMPEKNDDVRIEFPNTNDRDAFAVSSISKYNPKVSDKREDRMGDTEVRYIRNPQGMEVTLTPTQVIISANNEGVIIMDEIGNITVFAKDEIAIKSGREILLDAGESIVIQAEEKINIKCQKAEINMDSDGVIQFLGNEIYTN